jgi:hypothetical protein
MASFFTIFLIEDKADCPLKDCKDCLQKGSLFVAANTTRIADIKNKTIRVLEFNEQYTLPTWGWVISPYITYHDEHLRYIRHFKGQIPYDYACLFVDVATERLYGMIPQKPVDIHVKNRWLRQIEISRWVDSVLDDWVMNYSL